MLEKAVEIVPEQINQIPYAPYAPHASDAPQASYTPYPLHAAHASYPPYSPHIINTLSVNNMPIEDKNTYLLDSFMCCLLYFCCFCAFPFNIFCGVYSYLLAKKDTSNNEISRLLIKGSIIFSLLFGLICFIVGILFAFTSYQV